jgi:hypothetical protein
VKDVIRMQKVVSYRVFNVSFTGSLFRSDFDVTQVVEYRPTVQMRTEVGSVACITQFDRVCVGAREICKTVSTSIPYAGDDGVSRWASRTASRGGVELVNCISSCPTKRLPCLSTRPT